MVKRTLSLLMVMMLVLFSVSIITAQDEEEMMMECPEGEPTVSVALGAVGAEREVGAAGAERYMEMCPNVTVELLEMPDSSTERLALYQQFWEAQSGDVDVLQVDVIWPGIIAEHTVDMTEYLDEETIGMYFEGMIEGQTIDGRLVALPWFTDAPGLYYRTDLLEKYDVEVPQTWDELTEAAQVIQDGEREDNDAFSGFVWQGAAYEGLTCNAHEWIGAATGNTFITPEGEINVNNGEVIAAIERAAGWVGTISPEAVTGYQEPDTHEQFAAGNAAFARNWPYQWGINSDEGQSAVAGMFDYAPLPVGESGESVGCLGGWQLAVSQYSENVEASVSVVAYLTSYDEQLQRAISPFSANPTIPALYEDEELLEANELFSRLGPILDNAVARPSGITGASYNDASELFYTAVSNVLTGQEDAATAMDNLELDLEDLLLEIGAIE
jgi:trehalose/maltose transport system substrate-binding protein